MYVLLQVPPITNYTMINRTYRYFKGVPLYPFGYGLWVLMYLLYLCIVRVLYCAGSFTQYNIQYSAAVQYNGTIL